jgi:hypothetical protein
MENLYLNEAYVTDEDLLGNAPTKRENGKSRSF